MMMSMGACEPILLYLFRNKLNFFALGVLMEILYAAEIRPVSLIDDLECKYDETPKNVGWLNVESDLNINSATPRLHICIINNKNFLCKHDVNGKLTCRGRHQPNKDSVIGTICYSWFSPHTQEKESRHCCLLSMKACSDMKGLSYPLIMIMV